MKTLLGIGGTTCVGKSEVAVRLAKMLGAEIISADSAQIYKGMDVGTAKITPSQMQGVKHHMLDVVEPSVSFSSFQYAQQASKIIDATSATPIIVGGTGFYFDSLVYPPEFGQGDPARRKQLQQMLEEKGLESLCEMLRKLDFEAYAQVDLKNPVRVLRAVEIAELGQSIAAGKGKTKPRYNLMLFVLTRDRDNLYKMIDKRVDDMISNGLVEEARALLEKYGKLDTSAFSAIGYKEIFEYIDGKVSLEEAINNVKLNTRHYAKRQITYFKKMNVAKFVDVEGQTPEQVAQYIYDRYLELSTKQ